MKNSKFSEVQIIKILSEQNQGKTVNEICREHGISQPTFYKWKSKYGGLDVQQLSKMKELEKELSQYKKNYSRTYPRKCGNERCNFKKVLTPSEKRELVVYSGSEHGISTRNACKLFIIASSVFYYKKKKNNEDDKIREELVSLADQHQTWGFWTMHHRLRNLCFGWNHKRVYRIYKSMKLNFRSKRKKRLPARIKEPLLRPIYPNITWSMDFMHDTLECGKSVRSLNIIDDFNR
jgi:putative transposase